MKILIFQVFWDFFVRFSLEKIEFTLKVALGLYPELIIFLEKILDVSTHRALTLILVVFHFSNKILYEDPYFQVFWDFFVKILTVENEFTLKVSPDLLPEFFKILEKILDVSTHRALTLIVVVFDFSNKNLYEDPYFSGFLRFFRQIFQDSDDGR
jgi:hypothetical protein